MSRRTCTRSRWFAAASTGSCSPTCAAGRTEGRRTKACRPSPGPSLSGMGVAIMPELANADKTLVMTATYNEIENLPRLVDEVFAVIPGVDFLVVDDNSPDGTGAWCDERAAVDPRARCLHRAGKLGLGTAIIAGMK